MHRYPVRVQEVSEDSRTIAEHNKALQHEMQKGKPRDSVLLPLMKSTFNERRIYMQNDANTVKETLEIYSALARPAVVRFIVLCLKYRHKVIFNPD